MSNATQTPAVSATTTAAPEKVKATRESRNNHKAAEKVTITDAASAQRYADAVVADTRSDKDSNMFNGSGFVTPGTLNRQDVDNLIRMGASLVSAIASKVSSSEEGEAARNGLTILINHASNAGTLQETARIEALQAELASLTAKQGKGKAQPVRN